MQRSRPAAPGPDHSLRLSPPESAGARGPSQSRQSKTPRSRSSQARRSKNSETGPVLADWGRLLEHLPLGVCIWRLERGRRPSGLRLVSANRAAREFSHMPLHKMKGWSMRKCCPGLARESLEKLSLDAIRSGRMRDLGEVNCGVARRPAGIFSVRLIPLPEQSLAMIFQNVTGRKKVEEELRREQERFHNVSRATIDAVWDWDFETNQLWWNQNIQTLFGFSAEEVGSTIDFWAKCLHPDDSERVIAKLHDAISGRGRLWSDEYRFRRRDGSYAWIFDRGYLIRDAKGDAIRMIGAMQDITQRKKAEQELKEREYQLSEAQRLAHMGSWEWDVKTDRVSWSAELYSIFGLKRDQFGGTLAAYLDRVHPEDRAQARKQVQNLVREKSRFSYEHRILQPDGTIRYLHTQGEVQTDAHDKTRRVVGCCHDVTERKRAEEEVRLLETTTRAVSEAADLTSALQAVLRRVCEATGWTAGSAWVPSRDKKVLVCSSAWHSRSRSVEPFRQASLSRTLLPGEGLPGRCWSSRQPVWIDVTRSKSFPRAAAARKAGLKAGLGVPVLADDEVMAVIEFFSDKERHKKEPSINLISALAAQVGMVIRRKRAEEELRSAHDRLKTLSRRLLEVQETERRHLARELHDAVGQSLTLLQLGLDVCARSPAAELPANLREAQRSVKELTSLVRNLSLELRPSMLDDLGLIPALLWLFGRYAAQTRLRLSFKHSGVARKRFPTEIETTAYRIIQETLTNVSRHAAAREVSVALRAERGAIKLRVQDDGRGFHVGRAFAAVGSSGLYGMRERAGLLGGHFEIHSSPGKGTVVTTELPLPARSSRVRKRL